MKKNSGSNNHISAKITGTVSGQVAVGNYINQNASPATGAPLSATELTSLRQILAELEQRVAEEAPPEKQQAALERVAELQEAITATEPDLSTMEYVKGWFAKNLPGLAGAVASVIVNPIVGKLVEAAGDTLAAEFRRRFST